MICLIGKGGILQHQKWSCVKVALRQMLCNTMRLCKKYSTALSVARRMLNFLVGKTMKLSKIIEFIFWTLLKREKFDGCYNNVFR